MFCFTLGAEEGEADQDTTTTTTDPTVDAGGSPLVRKNLQVKRGRKAKNTKAKRGQGPGVAEGEEAVVEVTEDMSESTEGRKGTRVWYFRTGTETY